MEIKTHIVNTDGKKFDVVFRDEDPAQLTEPIQGVHAFCFYGGELLIVRDGEKNSWTPPGGGAELGETYEEAVVREVKEESNMRVLHHEYIGYQIITEEYGKIVRQTRSFCIVEPYGDFAADPDGDIVEIKLIDPQDYKQYFDWGIVGDAVMKRAIEMNKIFVHRNSFM